MEIKRDNFKSSFGVLLAMAGSAVGLGNLWRFPYLVGTNGGAAFIIIYLFMVFVLCLPILFSEIIIGRKSQSNAFGAFKVLAPGSKWGIVGLIAVIGSVSIISFYSVVGGWTIDYLFRSVPFSLTSSDPEKLEGLFSGIVSSSWEPLIYLLIFLGLTALIVIVGVQKGIEKFSKVMMPFLFVTVLVIAIRSLTLPGASEGVSFLLKPDFSKVTADTLLNALGQAFFSLSIGCGTMLTYASYMKKSEKIVKTSSLTSVLDTSFALIAGLAIMPAVFAYGISPGEGPGLVFITLPHIFSQMPGGSIISILFFFVLFLAAVTSSISLLEVIVAYIIEEFKVSRKASVGISFGIIMILGILCSLSQGVLSDVKIFGYNFFDFFDSLSANILMPVGGLLVVVFVGWKMKKSDYINEITNGGTLSIKGWLVKFFYFIIRYIAPVVIITIMVAGLVR